MIRLLLADDQAMVRSGLRLILEREPDLEVVAEAADGAEAVEMCARLRPDVVTMDVVLPIVSGLAVTQQLMQICPTPILIISAAIDPAEPVNTFAALTAGAVDVLEKPRNGTGDNGDWDRRLLSTVKLVARIQVITHLAHHHTGWSARSAF